VSTNKVHQRVRSGLLNRLAYVSPSAGYGVKLDAMESPYEWPGDIQEKWLLALKDIHLNRYPNGSAVDLCAAIRQWAGIDESLGLVLGNGSDELIQMIAMTVCSCERPLLSTEPTFSMYRIISESVGSKYIDVPLTEDFDIDLNALLAAIDKHDPGCIFFAYPNNPTGNLFDPKKIQAVTEAMNGLVIIDEAYFSYSRETFMPYMHTVDNVAVLRTFSKFGLAGLRLGFLVGPKSWLREIDKVRLPYNISTLTQVTGQFALSCSEWFESKVRDICFERERFEAEVRKFPQLIVYPSAANFFLIRFEVRDMDVVVDKLLDGNIMVKNLDNQHEKLRGCIRVTVGTPDENDQFLQVLRKALD